MRWLLVLSLLAGCDQVFGLDRGPIDAPGSPADAIDAMACARPSGTPQLLTTALSANDFAPAEDETFAMLTDIGRFMQYSTNNANGMFTQATSTTLAGSWLRMTMLPGGGRVYLADAVKIYTSTNNGDLKSWTAPSDTNLPQGWLPGRPTADGDRIFVERNNTFQEYQRVGADPATWVKIGPEYSDSMLGHGGAPISYPNLTADGQSLVFLVGGSSGGIAMLDRQATGLFVAAMPAGTDLIVDLPGSQVLDATLVACKRLYFVDLATRKPIRYQFP